MSSKVVKIADNLEPRAYVSLFDKGLYTDLFIFISQFGPKLDSCTIL